ncbi:MAG: glycosyltransferase family 2 protein [Nitrospira sp. LK70]|nr:glycosyltransferase family 2 protein [Nitrospira sp. LK70]
MKLPNVTVVIVNWNGERFLERCLTALLNQTISPSEIVLVDNASSDTSIEIARRFTSVRILMQSTNLGFARGNNVAVKAAAAESEWIALVNPDAFPDLHWLEALLTAAWEYPEFDVFGSKLVKATDPAIFDGVGDAYHMSGLVWRIKHGAPVASCSEPCREVFSPCAAAALYRRSALREVGGFDEDFFCYVEDVDLGFRLRLKGHKALYVPDAVVHHVGSSTTGGQHSDFSVYHGHRNLVWTFLKNMPGMLFWLLLPLHVGMNLATILWFAVQGRGGVILRAKRDALLGLPKMWRKRQVVQSTRIATVREFWRLMDKQLIPAR